MSKLNLNIFVGGSGKAYIKIKESFDIIENRVSKTYEDDQGSYTIKINLTPPDNISQEEQNDEAKSADLMFMFIQDGLGNTLDVDAEKILNRDPYKEFINGLATQGLDKKNLTTCCVSEIAARMVIKGKYKIYYFVNYDDDINNDHRELLFAQLQNINNRDIIKAKYSVNDIKDFSKNHDNNVIIVLLVNAINNYIRERIKYERNRDKNTAYVSTLHNFNILHGKYNTCPYDRMYDLLDDSRNIISFNLRTDLSTYAIDGSRMRFGAKLREKIINRDIHFTRISAFNSFKKLKDAISEINENAHLNLYYYPYFDIAYKKEEERDFHPFIYDRSSMVLFSKNPGDLADYNFAFWGLYPDSSIDPTDRDEYNVAIEYSINNQIHPVVNYVLKITGDLDELSPLYLVYSPQSPQFGKRIMLGFYSRNFMILLNILEKSYNMVAEELFIENSEIIKEIKDGICWNCIRFNKSNNPPSFYREENTSEMFLFFERIFSLSGTLKCNTEDCPISKGA